MCHDVAHQPAMTERRGLPLGIIERLEEVAELVSLLVNQRPHLGSGSGLHRFGHGTPF
jgi:hypothetical protein